MKTVSSKIRVGISFCLLGEEVRFDGGHKRSRYLTDTLGPYVEYVPVCPEVECGLGIPRESVRLEGTTDSPRLIGNKSKNDVTDQMLQWAKVRVRELEKENLTGFVFKARSPSCGMERVKVYGEKGMPGKSGVGLFARAFMDRFPLLPVEEEGRLNDPPLRENFIERLFAFKRWQDLLSLGRTRGRLVDFHADHKLLLMSHHTVKARKLGKLVGEAKRLRLPELFDQYQQIFVEALGFKATPAKHCNVLHHILGYFKRVLSADEKKEVLEVIESYRNGFVPLIVPITLLKHYVRKFDETYLGRQIYLSPHPAELALRNHV